MKSPITDTTLGIKPEHSIKFRDVRSKARDEYIERAKKKKKDPRILLPSHKIGDLVVISERFNDKTYHLIEIIDFVKRRDSFSYFGIIQKSTDPKMQDRIGRLIQTNCYYSSSYIENIPIDSIKWTK
jgi:hypothetical protein